MASSPITSWKIEGETIETVTDSIFLGSQITVDGDFSHEIKRHLLLGRKAVHTNLHIDDPFSCQFSSFFLYAVSQIYSLISNMQPNLVLKILFHELLEQML